MMLTKNAMGNLVNKYVAVLRKCALLNVCVLGLVCGAANGAWAGIMNSEVEPVLSEDGATYIYQNYIIEDKSRSVDGFYLITGGMLGTNENYSAKLLNYKFNNNYLSSYQGQGVAFAMVSSSEDVDEYHATIEDTTFENNKSACYYGFGGAVYTNYSKRSIIIDKPLDGGESNVTQYDYEGDGNLSIVKSEFLKNAATSTYQPSFGPGYESVTIGGAVYLAGFVDTTISDSLFEGNFASCTWGRALGGAIYSSFGIDYNDEYKYDVLKINNTNFNSNQAVGVFGQGGVIYVEDGLALNITDSNFNNNVAKGSIAYGGAICSKLKNNITIENSSFVGNKVKGVDIIEANVPTFDTYFGVSQQGGISLGGAIYSGTVLELTDVTFQDNEASGIGLGEAEYLGIGYGGAIYKTAFANDPNNAIVNYTLTGGKTIAMTGNKATSGGGFLYLDKNVDAAFNIEDGALLSIGTLGMSDTAAMHEDSIYGGKDSRFTKSGNGDMVIHSDFDFTGHVVVESGKLIVEGENVVDKNGNGYSDWVDEALEKYADTLETSTSPSPQPVMMRARAAVPPSAPAMLVVSTPFHVGESLTVGTPTPTTAISLDHEAHFGPDSVLIINVDELDANIGVGNEGAAIIGEGTHDIIVENGAKLVVYGGVAGKEVRVTQAFDEHHDDENVDVENAYGWNEADEVIVVDPMLTYAGQDVRVEQNGTSFILILGTNQDGVANVTQLAAISGVASNTAAIANSAVEASGARYAIDDYDPELFRGFAVWGTPLFSSVEGKDFHSGDMHSGYDTTFGGINVGADYTTYKGYRFGLALHAGYGETESNGDFMQTDNDFSFWGATLYGGLTKKNFSFHVDLNYSMSCNDMNQETEAGIADVSGETNGQALSAEARLDYRFKTDIVDVTPYVGARFMHLMVDDYKVSQLGKHICQVETDGMNIWSFPIGFELSKDFYLGGDASEGSLEDWTPKLGWTIKPSLNLGVVFNTGDLDAMSTGSNMDKSIQQTLAMQAFDDTAWTGSLGFEVQKDAITLGLDYGAQLSEHQTIHNVSATARYEF